MVDARHHFYQPHRERDRAAMLQLIEGTDADGRQLCCSCRCPLCGPVEHKRGECEPCTYGDAP